MATMEQLKIDEVSYSPEQGLSCNTADLNSIFADLKRQKREELEETILLHFKIDEKQLLICNPGINFKDGDKPRIEFKQ